VHLTFPSHALLVHGCLQAVLVGLLALQLRGVSGSTYAAATTDASAGCPVRITPGPIYSNLLLKVGVAGQCSCRARAAYTNNRKVNKLFMHSYSPHVAT
jgi:hypothetical protein